MLNTGHIVFFVISACCALPYLEGLFITKDVTLWKALVAIGGGGGLVALYQIVSARRSDRSSEALKRSSDAIEHRVEGLSRDLGHLRLQVATLGLDEETRLDRSEAGMAWKRIQALTTRDAYAQYVVDHPHARYATEAAARCLAIEQWGRVERTDPFDIHFFILSGPFEALRMEAESAIPAALESARREHRDEFWRQVSIPFYIFAPLGMGLYVGAFGILMGLYTAAEHPAIAGPLSSAAEALRSAALSWRPVLPAALVRALSVVLPNLELMLRLAFTAVVVIILFTALVALVGALWRDLVQPRIDSFEKELNKASDDRYREVWHGQ